MRSSSSSSTRTSSRHSGPKRSPRKHTSSEYCVVLKVEHYSPRLQLVGEEDYVVMVGYLQAPVVTCTELPSSGVGIKCDSRLTVPDTDNLAPGLRIGERVPWVDVTRQSDWRPSNLLELMTCDGHFKLIILPGDTRDPSTVQRFREFSGQLVERLGKDVLRLLDIVTVLDAPREVALEELQLPPAFRSIEK